MFPNQQRSPHSLGPQSKIPQGLAGSGAALNQSVLAHGNQSNSRYSDYSPMSNKVNQQSAGGKYNYDYAGANGMNLSGVSPTPGPSNFSQNLGVGLTASGIGLGEQLHLQNELKLSQISNQSAFGMNPQRPTLSDLHSQHQLPLTLQNQNRIRDAISTESLRFQRPLQQQVAAQPLSLQKENPLNVSAFSSGIGLTQLQQLQSLQQQQQQQQQSASQIQPQQPANIANYLQQLQQHQLQQQQQQQQQQLVNIDANGNSNALVNPNPLLTQAQIQQQQQQQQQLIALQQIQALQGQNPQQQLQQLRQMQQADMAKLLQAQQQMSQQQTASGSSSAQLQIQLQMLQLQQQHQLQQQMQMQQQQQQTQPQVQPPTAQSQQQPSNNPIQNQLQMFMLQQMMQQNQQQQQQTNPQLQQQQIQQIQALMQQMQKQAQQQQQQSNTPDQSINMSQSNLATPLESSRILNAQSIPSGPPPQSQQNAQNPQQHSQFVQQYQQLNETMNQYRKLASMIGQQEAQKKDQLLQQQQQQALLVQQQQHQQQQQLSQQSHILQQQIQAKQSQSANTVPPPHVQQNQTSTQPDLNQSMLDTSRLLNASQMMMLNQDPNFNQSPIKGTQNSMASVVWPSMHQIDQSSNQILNKSLNISNNEKSFASPSSSSQQNQEIAFTENEGEKANFKTNQSQQEQDLKLDVKMQSSPTQDSQQNSTTPHSQRAPSLNPHSEIDQVQLSEEGNLVKNQNPQLNHHQQSYASELDYETKFIEGDFDPSSARNHLFNPNALGGVPGPIFSNDFQSPSATQTLHLQQIHQQLASLSPSQQQLLLNQSILSSGNHDQFNQQHQIESSLLEQQQQLIEQQQREILRLSQTLDPQQNFLKGLNMAPMEMHSHQSSPEHLPFLMEEHSLLNQSQRSGVSGPHRESQAEYEGHGHNQTLQNYLDTSHISAQRVETDNTPRKEKQSVVDEQPISHQKLTFEEMLEQQLQQEGFSCQADLNSQDRGSKVPAKKEFLRRGSQTASALRDTSKSATKTYKYYADNFNTNGSSAVAAQQHQSPKGAKKVNEVSQMSAQKSPLRGQLQSAQKSGSKSAMRGRHSPKQASVNQSMMNNSSVVAANNRPRSSQQQYEPKFNSKTEEPPLRTTVNKAQAENAVDQSSSQAPTSERQISSSNQILNQSIATITDKGAVSSSTPSQKHQTSGNAKGKNMVSSGSVKKNLNNQFNYHSKPANPLENLRSSDVIPLKMDEQSQAAIAMLSERNSVAEFEQLEQECMNKYLQNQSMQIFATDAHADEDFDYNYIESQSVRESKPSKGGIKDVKKSATKKIKSPKGAKSNKKKRASQLNSPAKTNHNYQSNSQANSSSQNTQSCQETLETPRSSINPNLSKSISPTAMAASHSQTQDNTEQQRKMEQKLQELEHEIQRFKQEKTKVQTLQQEYEEQLDRVTREIEEFENRKEVEVEELQTWKNEQMQELAQEKLGLEAEKLELETERQKLAEYKRTLERQRIQDEEKLNYDIKCLQQENSCLLDRLKAYEDRLIEGEKEQRAKEQEWEEEREQMLKVIEKEQREKQHLRREMQQRDEVDRFKEEEERIKKALNAERGVQTLSLRVEERGITTDIQGGDIKLVKELRSFQTSTEQVLTSDAQTSTMPKQPKQLPQLEISNRATQDQIALSEVEQRRVLGEKLRQITRREDAQVQARQDELVPKVQQALQTSIETEKRDQMVMTTQKVLRDAYTENTIAQEEQVSVQDIGTGEVIFDLEIRRESSASQTEANVLQHSIKAIPIIQDAVSSSSRQQQNPVLLPLVNNSNTSSASVSSNAQLSLSSQPKSQQQQQQVMNQNYRSALPIDTKKVNASSSQGQSSPTASSKSTNRQQNDNSASKISQSAASNQQVYQVKKQGIPSAHSQQRVLSAHSNNSASQQNLLSQRSTSQQQSNVQEKTPVRQQQPVLQNQRSQDSQSQAPNEYKRVVGTGTASTSNKSDKDPQLQQPGAKVSQPSQRDPQDDFMSSQQPRLTDSQVDDDEEEEEEEDDFDLKFPQEYHGKTAKPAALIEEITSHDGKKQRFYDSGKKEVVFSNGVRREVWPTGYSVVYFTNNDIKQTFPDHKVVYYFAEAKTTQTTFPNGLQVFKFSNNQIEKHFQDGTKEISFPDGTIKCLFPDGEEESIFPDGTIQKIEKSGVRIIEFPSGQRDTLYPDGTKVREFEDGSIKKIHPDGKIEFIQPGSLPHHPASAHKRQQAMHSQMPLQSQQQQRPFSSGAATIVGGGSVNHGAVATQKANLNRLQAAAPQTSNRKK